MERKTFYKNCIVPKCKSSTSKTPGKIFFHVPKGKVRDRWIKAIKRDTKKNKELSYKSSLYCCEDHFMLDDDTQNYVQHKLTNVNLKLKPGTLPHRFECQKGEKKEIERMGVAKRRRIDLVKEAFAEYETSKAISNEERGLPEEVLTEQTESEAVSNNEIGSLEETGEIIVDQSAAANALDHPKQKRPTREKHFRSKKVGTVSVTLVSTGLSPIKIPNSCKNVSTQTIHLSLFPNSPLKNHISNNDPDYVICPVESDSSLEQDNTLDEQMCRKPDYGTGTVKSLDSNFEQDYTLKEQMCRNTILYIEKEPKLFLGIPTESLYLINELEKKSQVQRRNIYVVLKKIRLNPSFAVLAIDFGLSKSQISRIFKESLPPISTMLKTLVYWIHEEEIKKRLPIPFRPRYKKVLCIIDCMEIEIEKPSDSEHQSLTWSNYYKCNTMKYLISSTPDGFINFISDGFGGRASDSLIVDKSGFIEKLPQGFQVMADRGFKDIAPLLQKKTCSLVRPPSVSAATRCSQAEVRQAKTIAALRIHIERVIGRTREFKILLPHSCVDSNLIKYLDDIVVTTCGIINMQVNFLKKTI